MAFKKSERLFSEARKYIPGGVNSPVRAFRSVGGVPVFVSSGSGSRIKSVEGKEYIDFVCSWGPLIFGHSPKSVLSAVKKMLDKGTSFGMPTEAEVILAREIRRAYPSIELVRLVSSGTEATMSAIRVARGFTGKRKIIKFEGCYHGHSDYLLAKAGSGALTLNLPDSAGVPEEMVKFTIVLPYNDLAAVENTIYSDNDLAAVIVEPVAGNMGVVLPERGFLEGLRKITKDKNVILIFDEVITGFRLARGGAQELFGIKPDLTCLGKILGGGFPIGAYGGRKDLMTCVAPLGPVYQAGTLSGSPVTVTAGIATLAELTKKLYSELEKKSEWFAEKLKAIADESGIHVTINRIGSMFTVFFTEGPVRNFTEAKRSNVHQYSRFFHELLSRGIHFPPSQFEACFISSAHTDRDLEESLETCKIAFKKLKN